MFFLSFSKKAKISVEETIKWLIYFAILVATGFAIKTVMFRAAG